MCRNSQAGCDSGANSTDLILSLSCLDGALWSRCNFWVLRTSGGAVMSTACLRGKMAPLALMLVRFGSLPDQRSALVPGADKLTGFGSLSVGSHHTLVTLDFGRLLANSVCRALDAVSS